MSTCERGSNAFSFFLFLLMKKRCAFMDSGVPRIECGARSNSSTARFVGVFLFLRMKCRSDVCVGGYHEECDRPAETLKCEMRRLLPPSSAVEHAIVVYRRRSPRTSRLSFVEVCRARSGAAR